MSDLSRNSSSESRSSTTNEPDWTDQVTDLLIDAVDKVRNSATGPILSVARYAVYGVMAALVGLVALVLLLVTVVRFMDYWLPFTVWLPYLILGTVFTLAGLILLAKRRSA